MPTFKLTIAYDGTGFVGWQRQASGTSIQGLLEDALEDFGDPDLTVIGASRTDAGVHALGQVAGVSLARAIDPQTLARAINARLPDAVRVLEAVEAPAGFHARFDARSKTYSYRIWNGEAVVPFERAYTWHVPGPLLDLDAMAEAAAAFEGRHDFAAFQASGSTTRSTERVVFSSRVARGSGSLLASDSLVTFEICGDGFLRHMVRTLAGTLVDVGRGFREPAWAAALLASGDRTQVGRTAPAAGLFLVRVNYE
jgi:tRNA pseudouridine38-40 synthase